MIKLTMLIFNMLVPFLIKSLYLALLTLTYGLNYRASDILRKKNQNFARFSGANSRDFRGKKVKICGKISRFRGILVGKMSKFVE